MDRDFVSGDRSQQPLVIIIRRVVTECLRLFFVFGSFFFLRGNDIVITVVIDRHHQVGNNRMKGERKRERCDCRLS